MDANRTERGGGERTRPRALPSRTDCSVPPPDEAAHLDGLLMHELSALNYHLGQYVLRYYDADAGRGVPVTVTEELALADSVTTAAVAIRARAERRSRQAEAEILGTEDM